MKNWLIIGSTAQYHWFSDSRVPKDIDLLTPAKICGNESKVCIVDSQWHDIADDILKLSKNKVFADPDILFTLKVSHAHWDIKWNKTMFDIIFLQGKQCRLNLDLYYQLLTVWEKVHGEKPVNLNVSNGQFFADAVYRNYDHDHLHELVAFNGSPMHERVRPDLTRAWCSSDLFEALTANEKAHTALEEIMATAIERSRLSNKSSVVDRVAAMNRAHKQLCVTMTKGWFARYLILNYRNLIMSRRNEWTPKLNVALQHL